MSESATKERMIAAAVTLFSRAGFHGVTTKDIAHSANVSEGNIFRYFPSKRDLFLAAVDSELAKLSLRTGVLAEAANVVDSQAALRMLFELITRTVAQQPDLVRLVHFSALEFGHEMTPVFRKHLDVIVSASAANLDKWSQSNGFRDIDARVTVLSFVSTVVLLQNYSLFTGDSLPFPSIQSAAAEYAELWFRVLSNGSPAVTPQPLTAGRGGD
jgi:AcrR family transcriptional regulator